MSRHVNINDLTSHVYDYYDITFTLINNVNYHVEIIKSCIKMIFYNAAEISIRC